MDMLRHWYTVSEAMVYSRLRWLAYSTDMADIVYPSIEQLADDLCITQRQVIRCLQVLEDNNLLDIDRRWFKRRNNYVVSDLRNYPCKLDFYDD